ncbi:MAG: DegT/DnrJ/EryC1/StrS aminotransferase family protein, partial [Candidatus Rokubacteria bacterium]|nr:DegT/DnrJ/EryC1/StrS aminotransferase family protein [Candidatus Rokubacteria bacterium]
MYVPKRPGLCARVWWALPKAPPFPLSTSSFHWTGNGRQALGLALSAVNRVLVPAFICRSVVEALEEWGKVVEMYNVNDDLTVDEDDLLQQAEGLKAVIWVHYFGFPQQLEVLQAIRSREKLLLIEDCAHGFLSQASHHPLGSFGHCGMFSFRKMVPVAEGGGLVVNAPLPIPQNGSFPSSLLRAAKPIVDLMVTEVEIRLGRRLKRLRKAVRARKAFSLGTQEGRAAPKTISPLTRHLLTRFDGQMIRQRRRANYLVLLHVLRGLRGVQVVFPVLPDGVCPMAFPLWV